MNVFIIRSTIGVGSLLIRHGKPLVILEHIFYKLNRQFRDNYEFSLICLEDRITPFACSIFDDTYT